MALYDSIGRNYADLRRPDKRIASIIETALRDAVSVVNVGAGAGSYEPLSRTVLSVEPSEVMIRQRPAGAAPCLQGSAEALPLETDSVDAAMAVLSAHHWTDLERGLAEMARVARKRIVLLTWVPDAPPFWLTEDYFPEIAVIDRRIFPGTAALIAMLERVVGPAHVAPVPIPHDCTDGLQRAYWRRPEAYLSTSVRSAISSFTKLMRNPAWRNCTAILKADIGRNVTIISSVSARWMWDTASFAAKSAVRRARTTDGRCRRSAADE